MAITKPRKPTAIKTSLTVSPKWNEFVFFIRTFFLGEFERALVLCGFQKNTT
jgi:hypothetical protein